MYLRWDFRCVLKSLFIHLYLYISLYISLSIRGSLFIRRWGPWSVCPSFGWSVMLMSKIKFNSKNDILRQSSRNRQSLQEGVSIRHRQIIIRYVRMFLEFKDTWFSQSITFIDFHCIRTHCWSLAHVFIISAMDVVMSKGFF